MVLIAQVIVFAALRGKVEPLAAMDDVEMGFGLLRLPAVYDTLKLVQLFGKNLTIPGIEEMALTVIELVIDFLAAFHMGMRKDCEVICLFHGDTSCRVRVASEKLCSFRYHNTSTEWFLQVFFCFFPKFFVPNHMFQLP